MRKYISFAETEQILRVALGLPGSSIKAIAEATGIKATGIIDPTMIVCVPAIGFSFLMETVVPL